MFLSNLLPIIIEYSNEEKKLLIKEEFKRRGFPNINRLIIPLLIENGIPLYDMVES